MVLSTLTTSICSFLALLLLPCRSRLSTQLQVLALRHQLAVFQRGESREIQDAEVGKAIEVPEVGGIQHHYERRAI
jgi:hypothetical protein